MKKSQYVFALLATLLVGNVYAATPGAVTLFVMSENCSYVGQPAAVRAACVQQDPLVIAWMNQGINGSVDFPGFARHQKALKSNFKRGVYEWQAIYRRVQTGSG